MDLALKTEKYKTFLLKIYKKFFPLVSSLKFYAKAQLNNKLHNNYL